MKKSAIIFSPYFGKLPEYFDLWLKSCEFNSSIDFMVFTDDERLWDLPKNVTIKKMKFNDFIVKLEKELDITLHIESPYKLCDFKPVYGYVFREYIENYEYWGHCDLDMIFGNILKFMPSETYDKISHLGHLCLYRNDFKILKAFSLKSDSIINYEDIFSSSVHFGFDEIGNYGINEVFKQNNLSIYPYELTTADISPSRQGMVLAHYENNKFTPLFGTRFFTFENGSVYSYEKKKKCIEKKEYSYIHFQKRKFDVNINQYNNVLFTNDTITDFREEPIKILSNNSFNSRVFFNRYKFKIKSILIRVKRNKEIKKIKKRK